MLAGPARSSHRFTSHVVGHILEVELPARELPVWQGPSSLTVSCETDGPEVAIDDREPRGPAKHDEAGHEGSSALPPPIVRGRSALVKDAVPKDKDPRGPGAGELFIVRRDDERASICAQL